MAIASRSESVMEHKIISISSKRQITIPQKYFEVLGFDGEAECILQNGGIFLRPVRMDGNEFAEQILAELIDEGLSGEALLSKFKERQAQIRPAAEAMLHNAEEIANGNAPFETYEDVFGSEDE